MQEQFDSMDEPLPEDPASPAPTLEHPPGKPTTCRAEGCGQKIWWIKTASGRLTPVNADSSTHWGQCPGSSQFTRRRNAKGRQ